MTLQDINEVYKIELLSFPSPWTKEAFYSEITASNISNFLTAKLNGNVLGYIGIHTVIDESHITNIAVHPDFRRLKIGESLLIKLLELIILSGIKTVTLEVRENNIPALNLYKKYRFIPVNIRKKYYKDNDEDAIIMKLTITNPKEFLGKVIKRNI